MPRGRPWPYSLRQWIKDASTSVGDECVLWPFKVDMKGYPYAKHKNRAYRPTRLMCRIANGPTPAGKVHAAHQCGNKACMNPLHLRWATPKENEADKRRHGRIPHKISDNAVLEVRAAYDAGVGVKHLGRKYGVSHSTISRIVHGRRREYVYKEGFDTANLKTGTKIEHDG